MTDKFEVKDGKTGDLLIPQERRDYPRVAVAVTVRYRLLEQNQADEAIHKKFNPDLIYEKYQSAEATNLSTSGLLMVTSENVPEKSFLLVSMYLPLPGLSCSATALAECIRCTGENGKNTVALKFLKVLHHDLNKYKFCTLTDLLDIRGEEIKLD